MGGARDEALGLRFKRAMFASQLSESLALWDPWQIARFPLLALYGLDNVGNLMRGKRGGNQGG